MSSPDQDAENLRNSLKSGGVNEDALINIITQRTNKQRMKILESYKSIYNRDLLVDLKKELSSHFLDTCIALFSNPIDFDSQSLRSAMKGIGTDEDTLIEILSTRPGYMIRQEVIRYQQIFKGRELGKDVDNVTSGIIKKVLLSLLQGNRSENPNPDIQECEDFAKQLYESGEKKWGNDDSVFIKIITLKSPMEIACISRAYHKQTGHNILQAINNEFSGDIKKFLTSVFYAVISPSEYFATRINKALRGLGTNDKLLIRVLVARHEIDITQIKTYYKQLYTKDMIEDIKAETSGGYKKILVKLAGGII